jgi:pyridoxal phosphate enzyme (YggS family)
MGSVAENLAAVEARIKSACTRVGRDPSEVRLLPVSKSQGMELIAEAYEAGVRLLGENRVQEAAEKARHFADHPDLKWAIIGHLQTNKARQVAAIASEFHALSSVRVAAALDQALDDQGRSLDVFLQVNSSGEPQKFGLPPDEVEPFAIALKAFTTLRVRGLMTLAVLSDDERAIGPASNACVICNDGFKVAAIARAPTMSSPWACRVISSWQSSTGRRPYEWARRSSGRAVA